MDNKTKDFRRLMQIMEDMESPQVAPKPVPPVSGVVDPISSSIKSQYETFIKALELQSEQVKPKLIAGIISNLLSLYPQDKLNLLKPIIQKVIDSDIKQAQINKQP